MRKRPLIIAATSVCGILLLGAASFSDASGLLAGVRASLVVPAAAKVIRVLDDGAIDQMRPDSLSDQPQAFTLDSRNAQAILGSAVRSAVDEDMGRIVDVIVDRGGATRAVIIDFGGFLGVGSRKIAVDWNAMRLSGLNRITLDLTRDQLKAAPAYDAGNKSIVVLGAAPEFARSRVTERMPER